MTTAANPADPLQDLNTQLQQGQTNQDQQTRQNAALKQDIAALQNAQITLNQTVTAYSPVAAGLALDNQNLANYRQTKQTMIEAVIGKNKEAIDKAIVSCEGDIATADQKQADAGNALQAAQAAYDAANTDLAAKQKAFDDLKTSPASLAKTLADAKSAKNEIEGQNQPATSYFLLRELQAALDNIKVTSANDFQTNMNQVWANLRDALRTASAKKETYLQTKAAYDAAAKAAADQHKNRKDTIKAAINPYNSATQSAAAPAPQAQAAPAPQAQAAPAPQAQAAPAAPALAVAKP